MKNLSNEIPIYKNAMSAWKNLFIFIYLTNEPSTSQYLDLIIKRVKLKHKQYKIGYLFFISS